VTGLSGTLVLRNGTEPLAVAANGVFTFANRLTTGQSYNVTVDTQPVNQTCTVNNGSGTVAGANVTSIAVVCAALYTIGGTVTGLNGTVTLRNGAETLSVSANGPFTFVNKASSGQSYSVTVATNPAGQVCMVANGAGTVGNANVTNITVSCFTLYSIGGTVTGLNGTVVLRNGTETLSVSSNGTFTFVNKVPSGQSYSVSVAMHPASQTCGVSNGSGTVGNGDVTSVSVTCVTNNAFHTIGGTVTGLTGTVVLLNNSETLAISTNGPFAFLNGVLVGQPYSVSVQTQPAGQTCTVSNGSGTVGSSNVTNVVVSCTTNIVTYSIGGTVTGLSGGTLQLRLTHAGSSSTIDVTSNGSYNFDPDKVESGDSYSVTVSTQPTGQECTVSNDTGTANGTVSNANVECVVATLTVGGNISGLSGAGLRIENGASNSVSPSAGATKFTLPDEFNDKTDYDVGIAAQPAGQTCVITHSQGQLDGEDVTDIEVSCVANSTSSLVGTYKMQSDSVVYLTLFADGVYIYGSVENDDHCGSEHGNGVEYGVYTYDQASGSFVIWSAVVDTNGDCGVWDNGSRFNGTLAVTSSGQGKVLTLTTSQGQLGFQPVDSTAGTIYGSFADRYHRNFSLFIENGGPDDLYFFDTETQAGTGATSGHDAGVEYGCGKINGTPSAGTLHPDLHGGCKPPAPHHDDAVDTNGTSGLSSLSDWDFTVVSDTLSSSTFDGTRIEPN
jgi:hypothetical protein